MEHGLLETVAMLGLDVILIATLALFALHAIETWRSRRRDKDASQETVDAVDFQMHDFPRARRQESDGHQEEQMRRAA